MIFDPFNERIYLQAGVSDGDHIDYYYFFAYVTFTLIIVLVCESLGLINMMLESWVGDGGQ